MARDRAGSSGAYLRGNATPVGVADEAARFEAVKNLIDPYAARMQEGMQRLRTNMSTNALYPRGALMSGALMAGLGGLGRINEGEVGEGIGQMIGGGVGAVGAGAAAQKAIGATRLQGSPIKSLIGIGAASLFGGNVGGMIGAGVGGVAEDKVGAMTGRGDSRGAARKRTLLEAQTQAEALGIMGNAVLAPKIAAQKDLMMTAMNNRILESQRMLPIINEMKNADAVRQQAINASQANNYMNMGVVATAGKLATGAQEQAGANLRTAMVSNPYANSVLQAPSISFG